MVCWATIVLPLLMKLERVRNLRQAHVVEDTILLAPGMTYNHVKDATAKSDGGFWGCGKYEKSDRGLSWYGSKGMSVRPAWWRSMSVVLENIHF